MEIVQGYTYDNEYDPDYHNTVCRIVARAEPNPVSHQAIRPTFLIRFGDGRELITIGEILHPWYPVD